SSFLIFFLQSHRHRLDLLSFPTRRSSDLKSVYQTLPSLSTSTSCGSVVGRTMSYSVTMARVSRPLGRGSVFNSYVQWSTALRLRSEEHTSELQSPCNIVCRLLLEKKKKNY